MNLQALLAGVSMLQKFVPVLEAGVAEIGPLVKTEVANGEEILAVVEKALGDLKTAFETVKVAVNTPKP